MLESSDPPILDTPISPYLDDHAFKSTSPTVLQLPCADHALPEMATNLDGKKFRNLTGFKLLYPRVETKSLEAVVTKFQEEGIW